MFNFPGDQQKDHALKFDVRSARPILRQIVEGTLC